MPVGPRSFSEKGVPILMKRNVFRGILLILLLAGMVGCGWWKGSPVRGGTPERLYQSGYQNYHEGDYEKAIEAFQRLQEQYPLSDLALKAELGIADSHYSAGDFVEAEMSYLDFASLHPTNENVPYAMYQIGMCHFQQIGAVDRDQTETLRAKQAFERLVARFPQSKFSMLAEKMIRDCKQKLAEHEFYVGNFYFKLKLYTAALGRFETIRREYSGVGLDYRVERYIEETKARLAAQPKDEQNAP